MNTQSNTIPVSPLQSQVIAPVTISPAQSYYWAVRREIWEYRSLYLAPLAVAALFLVGFMLGTRFLLGKIFAASALAPAQQQAAFEGPFIYAAFLMMGTAFIVTIFYCLDALHGERRDRSILFWKSLPVSDLTTVLAKASIPVLIIPVITFVITAATWWIMLLIGSAALAANGMKVASLWTQVPWFHELGMLFYHLVGMHGLYYAPIYGWLLLVSAWARRAPFLWAAIPPLAIGIVEKIAFNTTHFPNLLGHLIAGGNSAPVAPMGETAMDAMTHPGPLNFFFMPSLWIGLAVFAAFLFAAIRLRRWQGPV
jgi:ABC-2 type transport system permease protein